MIALVLLVVLLQFLLELMLNELSSISTKTGVAFIKAMVSAVAMKVNGVVMISSPG